MNELIQSVERRQLRKHPDFREGDRVRVHFQVIEGNRKRTQVFEGVVIKLQGAGARRTFTVRKLSFGVGVERTFPIHSPKVERIEVMARGEVRRAKLYYLRGRIGRRARVRERRDLTPEEIEAMGGIADEEVAGDEAAPESPETAEQIDEQPDDDSHQPESDTSDQEPGEQATEPDASDEDEANAAAVGSPEASADSGRQPADSDTAEDGKQEESSSEVSEGDG